MNCKIIKILIPHRNKYYINGLKMFLIRYIYAFTITCIIIWFIININFYCIINFKNKDIENEKNDYSYTYLINKNLQDFTILSDLVCAYIPSLRTRFNEINRKNQSQANCERNSKIFMRVMDELLCTNYPKMSPGKVILGNIYGKLK